MAIITVPMIWTFKREVKVLFQYLIATEKDL